MSCSCSLGDGTVSSFTFSLPPRWESGGSLRLRLVSELMSWMMGLLWSGERMWEYVISRGVMVSLGSKEGDVGPGKEGGYSSAKLESSWVA